MVVDEEQKKGLKCFICSFLSNFIGGGHSFFKEGHLKKKGNPTVDLYLSNSVTSDVFCKIKELWFM